VRDEQVTYSTNQASRMAYARYRVAGWDIGSGMVEGARKHLIGARENGPGMRWSDAGAQHVAAVRVSLFNDPWDDLWAAELRQFLRTPVLGRWTCASERASLEVSYGRPAEIRHDGGS